MYLFKLANVAIAVAALQTSPLTDVKRLSDEPILTPRAKHFDDLAAYNPTAVKVGKKTVLLYRGQNKAGMSQIGYAESTDGVHFTRSAEPVFTPEADYEKDGGIEDPRIVKIGGIYYLTYTGYNKTDAQLCLATSSDLKSWSRVGIIMPANKGTWNTKWTKSGAILTTKINGKYWMYYLGTADGADQMGVASSSDLKHWQDATKQPVLPKRPGTFDSKVVEPGPAPLITDEGILLIYNGADDKLVYRTGWVVFDKKDPTRVLTRSDKPFFIPEKRWEIEGQVPNVVFVEGLTQDGNTLNLYYGAGDTSTGVVRCTLSK
jgi:predicted GH43/DUF377 family glycosyl hydrolase